MHLIWLRIFLSYNLFSAESTKTQVLKKFKGSRRDANITEKADKESEQNKNEPIMDENLEKLSLSKKTSEMVIIYQFRYSYILVSDQLWI